MRIVNFFKKKLSLSDNKVKVFRNVYWSVLGKMVNILSGLLVGILVARYLGPSDFGLMNYVISYVTLFNVLASFGFDNIEIRELSKGDFPRDKLLGTAFGLRIFLAILTYLLVLVTAFTFESDFNTIAFISVYSLSYLFSAFNIIRNYFTSIVLNEYVVKSEIFRIVIGSLIKLVLVLMHANLMLFFCSLAFDFLLISSGYIYSYRKKVGSLLNWKFDFVIAKYQLKESWPLLFSGAAILIYQKIDQLMIKSYLDTEAVGQYAVGAKLSEFAIFIPLMISQTISPMLVKIRATDILNYEKKRLLLFDIIFWSTFMMSFLMCICAKPIILILYGDIYSQAVPVFQIMAWKAVFSAMFTSSAQIIVIEKIQKYAVFRNILGCIFNISLNMMLIPFLGIVGSAIVSIITLLITGYLSHLIIPQYRFLFFLQTDSIFRGIFRIIDMLKLTIIKIRNV